MKTRLAGIALMLSLLTIWPTTLMNAQDTKNEGSTAPSADTPSAAKTNVGGTAAVAVPTSGATATTAPSQGQTNPVAPPGPFGVYFEPDGGPVQDQVPCILTQQQSYGGRALVANLQVYNPANIVAQAAEKAAKEKADQIAAEEAAQAAEKAAKGAKGTKAPVSPATQANPAAGTTTQAAGGPDRFAEIERQALQNIANAIRKSQATSSLYELRSALPDIQTKAVSEAVKEGNPSDVTAATAAATSAAVDAGVAGLNQAQAAAAFKRPPDISCSMSILSWDEAHKAFGRTIADTYLAAQITIRNLDANNEFLVHDAELAVDAYGAQLARFQVGHEKEIVRGVLQYGQNFDRQHISINVVTGIGTIMGAVVSVPSPAIDALTGATGAYTGGLLPVLKTLLPDLTTQNLNTLNDLAFSAASASKVVVPKSGSVPVVLFIPVKPLEEACWLQVGYNFAKDWVTGDACSDILLNTNATGNLNPYKDGNSFSGNQSSPCTLARGLQKCPDTPLPDLSRVEFRAVRYKHWTPIQVHSLELHSFGLIAGVHIQETGQPATMNAAPNCANAPVDSSGAYLKYALPAEKFSCSLTGTNLNTMTSLRLRAADNTKAVIDFKSSVSGDNTLATAVLPQSDYSKITEPSYELFSVDNSGRESDMNRTMKFRYAPTIVAAAIPPNADVATLTGTNLDGIKEIDFYGVPRVAGAVPVAKATVSNATANSLTFPVPAALTAGNSYEIDLVADGVATPYQTHTNVTH